MMASDLPDKFDVIVLGTGLQETLLAAAFSRIGLSVLHLDRNTYYCGNWASFSLRQIPSWIEEQKKAECYVNAVDADKVASLLQEGEKALQLPKTFPTIHHAHFQYSVRERPKPESVSAEDSPSKSSICNTNSTDTSDRDKYADEAQSTATSAEQTSHNPAKVDDTTDRGIVPGQFDSVSDDGEIEADEVQQQAAPDLGHSTITTRQENENQAAEMKEWFVDDLEKEWRKFSFDLAPKLLYCSGSMVELLIVSDVAKYCEFRTVNRILTAKDDKLVKVPCSRADVFSSKALSLLEKRVLMKFLTFAAEYDKHPEEYQDFIGKPFVELLAAKKLSQKMHYFVLYSIAMATEATSTEEGLQSAKKFISSLGRYGNTAFLFPLYGSAELPQGFCRLSAVFGGVYVLMMSVSHLLINSENKCTGVITSAGQRIECKYLIGDASYLPVEFYSVSEQSCISRGIYITDQSILPGDGEDLSLLQFPHEGHLSSPITTVLELPPSAMVTPRNLYVVHTTRRSVSDVHTDLQPVTSFLFAEDARCEIDVKPRPLWSLEFQMKDLSKVTGSLQSPDNVFVVTGPGIELDADRNVDQAKRIFSVICPEEEFLPKPPHPDDIIYVDTEEVSAAGKDHGDWTSGGDSKDTDADFAKSTVTDSHKEASADCAAKSHTDTDALSPTRGAGMTEEAKETRSPDERFDGTELGEDVQARLEHLKM